MNKTIRPLSAIAICLAAVSCGQKEQTPAEALMQRLSQTVKDGTIMYGHQDDLMYGHTWKYESGEYSRSDVKDVCGAYPAVYGLDLGGIELGDENNLDGNPFAQMRESAIAHYLRGGVVTFSWHPRNPLTGGDAWDVSSKEVVASVLEGGEKHGMFMEWLGRAADYLESFRTSDGQAVPMIFRPWHEHTGSWFWWGRNLCTAGQYIQLWAMTYDYLTKERKLDNLVWAYSPGAGGITQELYMERWPGDDMVEILGVDCYQYGTSEQFTADLKYSLDIMQKVAAEHGKMIAVTETGYEGIPDAAWWTETLLPALSDYPVAYVLTWRNAWDKPGHFYAPFPGQDSACDFKKFAESGKITMLQR